MARRKASARITPQRTTKRAGAWDEVFLGGNNRYNPTSGIGATPRSNNTRSVLDLPAIQQQAEAATDDYMQNAIAMAINGDDEELLPYQPTPTINPGRPRTLAAGYDEKSMTLRIKFRDGEIYTYYRVPPSVWWKFQRAQSPGRYINSTLNGFPYSRGLY